MKKTMKKVGAVGGTLLLAMQQAMAQTATTFDPSTYVSDVTGLIAGMLAIGGAVFGLNVAIKSTKWARRSL